MGSKYYGIVCAQNPDSVNEIVDLDGLEDKLRFVRDEHDELTAFRVIADVSYSKKIYSLKDCENEKQQKAWEHAKVPILYAEGTFFDDEDHPNAKSAVAILRYCNNNETSLKPGLSVDGAIVERQDRNGNTTSDRSIGKRLARTMATSGAFTVQPCNPVCAGALWLDEPPQLAKSFAPPKAYEDALKRAPAASSFHETPVEQLLHMELVKLKKSLEKFNSSLAVIKCNHCGKGERFFKSETPNACHKCGKNYTIKQIWESIQK